MLVNSFSLRYLFSAIIIASLYATSFLHLYWGMVLTMFLLLLALTTWSILKNKILFIFQFLLLVSILPADLINDHYIHNYSLNNIYTLKFFSITIYNWLIVLISIILILYVLRVNRFAIHKHIMPFIFLLIMMLIIGLMSSNVNNFFLSDIQSFLYYVLLFTITYILLRTEREYETIYYTLFILIQAKIVQVVLFSVFKIYDRSYHFSMITDSSFAFIAGTAINSLILFYIYKKIKLSHLLMLLPFNLLFFVFYPSRSYFIVWILALIILVFNLPKNKKNIVTLIFIILVIVLITGSVSNDYIAYQFKLESTIQLIVNRDIGNVNSAYTRVLEYGYINALLNENIIYQLFGRGAGSYFQFLNEVPAMSIGSYPQNQIDSWKFQPHDFLNFLLLKTGWIGLVLYVLFYLSTYIYIMIKKKTIKNQEVWNIFAMITLIGIAYIFWWSAKTAVLAGIFYGTLYKHMAWKKSFEEKENENANSYFM